MAVPEPELTAEERAAFDKGVAEFNAGLFFECHHTLEELWTGIRGPSRDFFQGLIQVSVAFYHLTSDNFTGAESMLARALKRFERYPDHYFGFDLRAHRAELQDWIRCVGDAATPAGKPRPLPVWTFPR
jgi:hypothetical protein